MLLQNSVFPVFLQYRYSVQYCVLQCSTEQYCVLQCSSCTPFLLSTDTKLLYFFIIYRDIFYLSFLTMKYALCKSFCSYLRKILLLQRKFRQIISLQKSLGTFFQLYFNCFFIFNFFFWLGEVMTKWRICIPPPFFCYTLLVIFSPHFFMFFVPWVSNRIIYIHLLFSCQAVVRTHSWAKPACASFIFLFKQPLSSRVKCVSICFMLCFQVRVYKFDGTSWEESTFSGLLKHWWWRSELSRLRSTCSGLEKYF